MANTKSAEKQNRQSQKHRARNASVKTGLRSQVRKFRETLAAGDGEKTKTDLKSAEIVTEVVVETSNVATENVALSDSASIVRLAGTAAATGFELVSVTVAPPEGAGAVRTTVPVALSPSTTVAGSRARVDRGGPEAGVTVRTACLEPPEVRWEMAMVGLRPRMVS